MKRFSSAIAGSILGVLLIAGCASEVPESGIVYVRGAPPPPIRERIIVSPGPNHVWVPGGWQWVDRDWRWAPGHYAVPPRSGARWVVPRYRLYHGQHTYRPGYWR